MSTVRGEPQTIDKAQQALALEGKLDYVYGYSFILTNLDVSTPANLVEVEHWYRHRTDIEALKKDAKHGAALRHLPSGDHTVNTAWMWAALLVRAILELDPRNHRHRRRPWSGPAAHWPGCAANCSTSRPASPTPTGPSPATTTRRRPAQRGPAPAAGPADHPRRINHTFPTPCPQPSPGPETATGANATAGSHPYPDPGPTRKHGSNTNRGKNPPPSQRLTTDLGQSGMTRPHAGERLRFPHQRMHKVTGSTRRPGGGGDCVHGGFLRPGSAAPADEGLSAEDDRPEVGDVPSVVAHRVGGGLVLDMVQVAASRPAARCWFPGRGSAGSATLLGCRSTARRG